MNKEVDTLNQMKTTLIDLAIRFGPKVLTAVRADRLMPDLFKPSREDEVHAAVRWAIAQGKSLEIAGHGSKRPSARRKSCSNCREV